MTKIPRWPANAQSSVAPTITSVGAAEAVGSVGSTDRTILPGMVRWADGGTHDCDTIFWRSGVSTAASFTLRVGLRDLDTANGPPGRDDGTVDQFGTHVNPASNTNFTTTLSAARTIATGDRLCVVWDFSAYTSGSIRVPAGWTVVANEHQGFVTFFNGTTYTLVTTVMAPMVTLEATDGTFGLFVPGVPVMTATTTTVTFANDDTPDERALAFTTAQAASAIDWGFLVTTVAGGSFEIVLYNAAGTALNTAVFDANTWDADAAVRMLEGTFGGTYPADTYYLTLKPTSTTDVTMYTTALTTGHLVAFGGESGSRGYALGLATRTDAGAWTTVDTAIPVMAYVDPMFDAAAGSSAGPLVGPGNLFG